MLPKTINQEHLTSFISLPFMGSMLSIGRIDRTVRHLAHYDVPPGQMLTRKWGGVKEPDHITVQVCGYGMPYDAGLIRIRHIDSAAIEWHSAIDDLSRAGEITKEEENSHGYDQPAVA